MRMRRSAIVGAALVAVLALPASGAQTLSLQASPNPAALGQRVSHTVTTAAYGRLEVWVSARGFAQPGMGTMPAGLWAWECCPSQTAGTAAWHYRSSSTTAPGTYRFGAATRTRGTYLSTASLGAIASTAVWVRVT